jgi:hypothetical protein
MSIKDADLPGTNDWCNSSEMAKSSRPNSIREQVIVWFFDVAPTKDLSHRNESKA